MGTLAEGDITADCLSDPLKGKTVKELFEEVECGTAEVAIHQRCRFQEVSSGTSTR